jgi:hypothetical protein
MYGRGLEHHQSVPQAIKTILASNDLYLQALVTKIANYTSLAQRIKPEVETITGSGVQLGTIVVAIKRFADTLVKERQQKDKSIMDYHFEGARMSLTGSIIDIDFNDREFDEIFSMLDEVFENENGSYNLFHTNRQSTLFTEDVEQIRHILSAASKKFDGKIKEGLSKITISLPSSTTPASSLSEEHQHSQQKPRYDMLSLVSDVLYNNQISLYNAFFAPNEIVLILNDKDAARAYEFLRAKISTR